MANRKINELNSAGTVVATDLIAVADPTSGIAEKAPLSDLPFLPKSTGFAGSVAVWNPAGTGIVESPVYVNNLIFPHLSTVTIDARIRMPNLGSASDVLTATSDTTGFARFQITATNAHPGAAAGALFINNVGSVLQLYAGSQANLYAPDGALIRTSGAGPLRLSSAGEMQFGRMAPSSPDYTMWGRFFGTGNFVLGNFVADSGHRLHVEGTSYFSLPIREVVVEHSDNAAAIAAGLPVGTHYRTGDLLKIVH